jgi:hypothetical protein
MQILLTYPVIFTRRDAKWGYFNAVASEWDGLFSFQPPSPYRFVFRQSEWDEFD